MSRKASHNARVRVRILAAAGDTFRSEGFGHAGIDAVMKRAGLTRGAFYAHFPSKDALLQNVLADEDLLLLLLRNRSTATHDALRLGLVYTFRTFLDPAHAGFVIGAWNLPALMRDAALGGQSMRAAYAAAFRATLAEMARGQDVAPDHPDLVAALTQAVGAIATAAACRPEETRDAVLLAARGAVTNLIEGALRDRSRVAEIRFASAPERGGR